MIQMYLTMFSGRFANRGCSSIRRSSPRSIRSSAHAPRRHAIGWNAIGLQTSSSQTFPGETMLNPSNGGVMAAVLLPAVQAAREAARRAQSLNNLKQQ